MIKYTLHILDFELRARGVVTVMVRDDKVQVWEWNNYRGRAPHGTDGGAWSWERLSVKSTTLVRIALRSQYPKTKAYLYNRAWIGPRMPPAAPWFAESRPAPGNYLDYQMPSGERRLYAWTGERTFDDL